MTKISICPPCVQGNCERCWELSRANGFDVEPCSCRHAPASQPVPESLIEAGRRARRALEQLSPVVAPEADVVALRHELDICVEEIDRLGRLLAEARDDLREKDRELVADREEIIALQAQLAGVAAGYAPSPAPPPTPTTLDELQALLPGALIEVDREGEVVAYTGWLVVDGDRLSPMPTARPAAPPPATLLEDPDALPPRPGQLI